MDISRRALFGTIAGATIASAIPFSRGFAGPSAEGGLSAEEALELLKAGNRAFVAARPMSYPFGPVRRRELAGGQHPFAVIVSCSDSRVGPEQLFERGLGELFVVRNAGSTVANAQALGSIEYAVSHLAVPLIVVLGHSKCGAVAAAAEVASHQTALPSALGDMVAPIVPAVRTAMARGGNLVEASVHENVRMVVHQLRSPAQPILSVPQRTGGLLVVGATYDLESGVVDFFDIPGEASPPRGGKPSVTIESPREVAHASSAPHASPAH